MDEPHLWAAIRYVELNPVRASMVARAEPYPWSSAAAHCGLRSDPLLSPLPESRPATATGWSEWLAEGENDAMLAKLPLHTRTGRPAGDDPFIQRLESQFGRTLRALPLGRPRTKDRPHSPADLSEPGARRQGDSIRGICSGREISASPKSEDAKSAMGMKNRK